MATRAAKKEELPHRLFITQEKLPQSLEFVTYRPLHPFIVETQPEEPPVDFPDTVLGPTPYEEKIPFSPPSRPKMAAWRHSGFKISY